MTLRSIFHRTNPSRWPVAGACAGALAGIAMAGCIGFDAAPTADDERDTAAGGNPVSATTAGTSGQSAAHALAARSAATLVASRPAFLRATARDAFVQGAVVSSQGTYYVPYERTFAGFRVVGGDLVMVFDGAGQNVYNSVALERPLVVPSTTPALSQAAAEAIATGRLRSVTGIEGTELVVHALGDGPRLAWESTVNGTGVNGISRLTVDVDAITGAVLREQEHVLYGTGTAAWNGPNPIALDTTRSGSTFLMRDPAITNLSCQDAASNTTFSGPDDAWGNGDATNRETGCVDALFGAQTEARMLSQWLGRNAMDGHGGAWPIRVGLAQLNAFYDGNQVQIGHNSANQWIGAIDVIAHEMGHGIDDHTPGGISGGGTQEFIADAFGASTETFANEPAPFDVPDFTVGEQINLQGHGPIRNMANPAAISGHPNCFSTSTPNLEVHAAAGPGNHWFYLLAEGSNPPGGQPTSPTCNGLPVFGIGVPAAIRILYNAMLMKTSGSSYAKYRTWTLQAAKNLWPGSCRRFDAVKAAWDAVSVPAQSADPTCTTNRPAPSSDILWRNTTTNQFVEWLMSDGEVGASVTLFTEPAAWHVQGTGDFNGDGTDDILWRNVDTGEFVEWLMSNGNVAASIPLFTEPAEWQVQGIGDFNGDGTSDILWRNVNTGQFAEWLMSNGGVGSVITLFTEPAEWQVQGIGDFNGDGSSDILWHNVNTGEFSEWLMVNGGVGASIPLFTEPAEWHVQGIGDFNGDGSSDILWRNVNTGEFVEWLMVNGNVGASIPLYTEPAEWQVQGIGDFDGDGTSDVLWRNTNTGQFVEWLMSDGGVGDLVTLFSEPAEWQVQNIGNFDGR